jgi:hypothetical protein
MTNIYHKKDQFVEDNKEDRDKLNEYYKELKVLKEDLLTEQNNSDIKYDEFKKNFQKNIIKKNTIDRSLRKMLEKDPMSVLVYLIELSIWSEKLGIKQLKKDEIRQISIINAFPLRTNIIPKYVDIDTMLIVISLLSDKK